MFYRLLMAGTMLSSVVAVQMAEAGIAIIVISSELPEVLALADRIVTMREGRVTGEVMRADATQEKLMTLMTLGSERAA